MADLGDIVVVRREDGTNEIGEDSPTRTEKNFGRGALYGSQNRGNSKVDGGGGLMRRTAEGEEGPMPQQEYILARFYKHHQREDEKYREFMKEELNTTFILALLFSGVVFAFITAIHSEFQLNPKEETNALLRVMIHTMDNTTFGGQVPTVPQRTGPPSTIVHVQAILLSSLCLSLLSAFLAMVSKQWLNRCTPVKMRGTIIERNQYRQRKLDDIVNWYFDHVVRSLPLMLQAALLLFGYALSRYLWEINTTIALVTFCATSFGALFCLFIVIAGAAAVNLR